LETVRFYLGKLLSKGSRLRLREKYLANGRERGDLALRSSYLKKGLDLSIR